MSGSGNKKSEARRSDDVSSSEVDDLLRAAEDHLLINLRLNSHPAKSQTPFSPSPSSSSSYLDSDLARRFDALRSPSNPNPNRNPGTSKSTKKSQEKGIASDGEGIIGDDLAARFAALKGSLDPPANLGIEKQQNFTDSGSGGPDDKDDGDGVSKREVEKLMEWAKDAARLDPSKNSDDDDDDENEEEEEEDVSDDSEEERRKRKEKSKGKPKRWIFF